MIQEILLSIGLWPVRVLTNRYADIGRAQPSNPFLWRAEGLLPPAISRAPSVAPKAVVTVRSSLDRPNHMPQVPSQNIIPVVVQPGYVVQKTEGTYCQPMQG